MCAFAPDHRFAFCLTSHLQWISPTLFPPNRGRSRPRQPVHGAEPAKRRMSGIAESLEGGPKRVWFKRVSTRTEVTRRFATNGSVFSIAARRVIFSFSSTNLALNARSIRASITPIPPALINIVSTIFHCLQIRHEWIIFLPSQIFHILRSR